MLPSEIAGKYLLIDGDIIRYRCGWAVENDEQFISGTEKERIDRAREFTSVVLRSFARASGEFAGEIWLSGPNNFREAIGKSKSYKGNRKDRAKPTAFQEIGTYLIEEFGAQVTEGVEADDELGIALTKDPKGSCIVSIDKDLLQISGWHWNWVKDTVQWVSRKAGDFNLYTQVLAGDPTDNVPGIKGIGPEKAAKILEGAKSGKELCQRAWAVYRSNCGGLDRAREYFMEQASLVYIHRRNNDKYIPPIELE